MSQLPQAGLREPEHKVASTKETSSRNRLTPYANLASGLLNELGSNPVGPSHARDRQVRWCPGSLGCSSLYVLVASLGTP